MTTFLRTPPRAHLLRTAYVAATLWLCTTMWVAWVYCRYVVGQVPRPWSFGGYWVYFVLDGNVADVYRPLVGILFVGGLIAQVSPDVRRHPSLLVCALLNVVTWFYMFFGGLIRE